MAKSKNIEKKAKNIPLKSFREDLENLFLQYNDSILANYIKDCLKEYDKNNITQKENSFIIDLKAKPEVIPNNTQQPPQPIPANVGNKVTTGWSNPFAGTSWGV